MTGDATRDALAEALRVNDYPPFWQRGRKGIADLLLPVVRRLCDEARAEGAAEALEAAADKWQWSAWAHAPRVKGDVVTERIATAQYVTDWLRARAAKVRPVTTTADRAKS